MQISRMPIPADDCVKSEMSVDTNSSEPKNDVETTTKVNGDSHKKLNGNTVDDSMEVDSINPTSEVQSEITVKEEKQKEDEEEEEEKVEEEKVPENVTESSPNNSDDLAKNGMSKEQESEDNIENCNQEVMSKVDNNINEDNEINKEVESMEIDENVDKQTEEIIIKEEKLEIIEEPEITADVIVKIEPQEVLEPEVTDVVEDIAETQKIKQLSNTEVSHSDEVIKISEIETNPVNGKVKPSDEDKIIKSSKVIQKVPEDEDMSSEISTETLSPKQVYYTF